MKLFLVGGAVRDRLLGIPPKDFDYTTAARPEEVIRHFEGLGHKVYPTGLAHGTVTVMLGKNMIEVTTFRKDVTADGRHAEVEFTDDLIVDLSRRDFTQNAMALDGETNTIIDPYGGQKDLELRLIRAVGDPEVRFQEDYLRVIRACRFAARRARKFACPTSPR